jgi:hypothetical protein
MIVWPEESRLTPVARENLARFRATAASKSLEADAQSWSFQSWARLADPPFRSILVSDGGETATLTIEDNGIWNLARQSLR